MTIYEDTILDRAFQALAHQTRRDIVTRLMTEHNLTAGAFTRQFDASQPTISRHLSQLEEAGLITRKIQGRTHVFSANPETLSSIDHWLSDHRAFWSGSLNRLGKLLDENDL